MAHEQLILKLGVALRGMSQCASPNQRWWLPCCKCESPTGVLHTCCVWLYTYRHPSCGVIKSRRHFHLRICNYSSRKRIHICNILVSFLLVQWYNNRSDNTDGVDPRIFAKKLRKMVKHGVVASAIGKLRPYALLWDGLRIAPCGEIGVYGPIIWEFMPPPRFSEGPLDACNMFYL